MNKKLKSFLIPIINKSTQQKKTRGPWALTVTWVSENSTLTTFQKGSYLHINSPIIVRPHQLVTYFFGFSNKKSEARGQTYLNNIIFFNLEIKIMKRVITIWYPVYSDT